MVWRTGEIGQVRAGLGHRNPSAVASDNRRVDVFAVANPSGGSPRQLVHWQFDATASNPWSVPVIRGWETLREASPSAISWGAGRLDIFAVGADDNDGRMLWWKFDGGWTENAQVLAGEKGLLSNAGPSAVAWAPGHIEVFAVSNPQGDLWAPLLGPRELMHWWGDGTPTGWSGPRSMGGQLLDVTPFAIRSADGRVDVFALSDDGRIMHWWWDSTRWRGPVPLPGPTGLISSGPCAVAGGPNQMDVFAVGRGRLQHWFANSDSWSGPETIASSGDLENAIPCALAFGSELQIFATSTGVLPDRHIKVFQFLPSTGFTEQTMLGTHICQAGPAAVGRRKFLPTRPPVLEILADVFAVHDADTFSGPADQLNWFFS